MQRKTRKIIGAVALIAALAAGGAAFTDANVVPSHLAAGYGTNSVSGATVTSLSYTLSTDGKTIVGATMAINGDLTVGDASNTASPPYKVTAGFNLADPLDLCVIGAHSGGAAGGGPDGLGSTAVTCGSDGGGTAWVEATASATNFHVAVTTG